MRRGRVRELDVLKKIPLISPPRGVSLPCSFASASVGSLVFVVMVVMVVMVFPGAAHTRIVEVYRREQHDEHDEHDTVPPCNVGFGLVHRL